MALPDNRRIRNPRMYLVWHPRRSGHVFVVLPAVCKTAGSAYVGSNPTPATTSQKALTVQVGAFFVGLTVAPGLSG